MKYVILQAENNKIPKAVTTAKTNLVETHLLVGTALGLYKTVFYVAITNLKTASPCLQFSLLSGVQFSQSVMSTTVTVQASSVAPIAASTPKKKKKSPTAKPAAVPSHPTTAVMVITAIKKLMEKKGSSLPAIKKYLSANYNVDTSKFAPFIRKFLKSAVIKGTLVQTNGTGAMGHFKLAEASKKKLVVAKKPSAAAAAKKKIATKKLAKASSTGSPKKRKLAAKKVPTTAEPAAKKQKSVAAKPKKKSLVKAKKVVVAAKLPKVKMTTAVKKTPKKK